MTPILKDARERLLAVTTFDRNVVVVAGAGTGKTALLTAKLALYLLGESFRRHPQRSPARRIGEVLAITFTEKASVEMANRLVDFLQSLASSEPHSGLIEDLISNPLKSEFGLSDDTIRLRAASLLEYIERIEIDTIHGFCSTLLRRYPLEVGIHPEYEVDVNGTKAREITIRVWNRMLMAWFGDSSELQEGWRILFDAGLTLKDVMEFTIDCVMSSIPYHVFQSEYESSHSPEMVLEILDTGIGITERILPQLEECGVRRDTNVRKLLESASYVFSRIRSCIEQEAEFSEELSPIHGFVDKKGKDLLKLKCANDLADQNAVIRDVDYILKAIRILDEYSPRGFAALWDISLEIIETARAECREEGVVTYEHLLLYAKELIRTSKSVVDSLKTRYGLLLVDEVQDTDPLQYEIVNPLIMRSDNPDGIRTFMVGDPKQSIYLFRNADVAIFQREIRRLKEDGGLVLNISSNFRTTSRLIDSINTISSAMFRREGVDDDFHPPYVPLLCAREADEPGETIEFLRLKRSDDEEPEQLNTNRMAGLAAETIAERISELHNSGVPYGDIGILIPTRSEIDLLMRALMERHIPVVLSGGADLYHRQEILDTLHLLKAALDPLDYEATMCVLSSPMSGVSNDTMVHLRANGFGIDFYYHDIAQREGEISTRSRQRVDCDPFAGIDECESNQVTRICRTLTTLHHLIYHGEPWDFFLHMRTALPSIESWIHHRFGDQAASNVRMLLSSLEIQVNQGVSLPRVIRTTLKSAVEGYKAEESPLAVPGSHAVHIETIHGAKGLEYPVVILTNLIRQFPVWRRPDRLIQFDHDTGTFAVSVKKSQEHAGDRISKKKSSMSNPAVLRYELRRLKKEQAERIRLLYVAFTRAKDRLIIDLPDVDVLSFLRHDCHAKRIQSVLEKILRAKDGKIPMAVVTREIPISDILRDERKPRFVSESSRCDLMSLIERHEKSRSFLLLHGKQPRRIKPSAQDEGFTRRSPEIEYPEIPHDRALRLGDLCHGILEHLNISDPRASLHELTSSPLAARLAGEFGPELISEAHGILEQAIETPFFKNTITEADEIRREIPILSLVDDAVMSGRIDLAVRHGHVWTVIDYKSDRIMKEMPDLRETYGKQGTLYCSALRSALFLEELPTFYLYFLRFGQAVRLPMVERGTIHSY